MKANTHRKHPNKGHSPKSSAPAILGQAGKQALQNIKAIVFQEAYKAMEREKRRYIKNGTANPENFLNSDPVQVIVDVCKKLKVSDEIRGDIYTDKVRFQKFLDKYVSILNELDTKNAWRDK